MLSIFSNGVDVWYNEIIKNMSNNHQNLISVSSLSLSLSLTQINSGEVSCPVVNAERSTTGVILGPIGYAPLESFQLLTG